MSDRLPRVTAADATRALEKAVKLVLDLIGERGSRNSFPPFTKGVRGISKKDILWPRSKKRQIAY
jgi:hypothetical protein